MIYSFGTLRNLRHFSCACCNISDSISRLTFSSCFSLFRNFLIFSITISTVLTILLLCHTSRPQLDVLEKISSSRSPPEIPARCTDLPSLFVCFKRLILVSSYQLLLSKNQQDGDELLAGLNNEDMMISNLSQVLDEERDARRSAEEENARLQREADGES